jgi:hypothetical protein
MDLAAYRTRAIPISVLIPLPAPNTRSATPAAMISLADAAPDQNPAVLRRGSGANGPFTLKKRLAWLIARTFAQ